MKTIIEPFRVKTVEPIAMTTPEQRRGFLEAAHYNLFALRAEDVLIDLMTDSGTSAMSAAQWGAMMAADESYAGSASFFRFEAAVKDLMPFSHIIPTHQGRAAEAILFHLVGGPGKIIPNNTHFDTTRGNVEATGAQALDLVCAEAGDLTSDFPFKGNMDVDALDGFLAESAAAVPLVMLTITNNAGGGQPVSLENVKATKAVCEKHGKPLFIDGCRFAENAYFIKLREPAYKHAAIKDIVREVFAHADGMTMSAKKDGFANIGGWLALNDDAWAVDARNRLILTEGFPTYGGLAGRDLDAIAVGLTEVIQEDYLAYRLRTAAYVAEALTAANIPMVTPVGGHGVFIDAGRMLPHIPALEFPGHALAVELYEAGGVRACEIGSVMFGRQADGLEKPAAREMVRLALPRRVYTQSHIDYVIECLLDLNERKDKIRGLRIIWEPPAMRHFTAKFETV